MNKLTTIAALPQAGGCMSSLPPEVTTWEDLIFPTIDYESAKAEAQAIEERVNKLLTAVQGWQ
jgi:hypothetical protein